MFVGTNLKVITKMFENLTERLSSTLNKTLRHITGKVKLTEENTKDAFSEIRRALLEADVALEVVKDFIESIKSHALGKEIPLELSPHQFFIKTVNEELSALMGEKNEDLNLKTSPPAVILLAGLQGCGKTTTIAKLAKFLQEKQNKKVMVTSCDVYRPAAIQQLETVAGEVNANFFHAEPTEKPLKIAKNALKASKTQHQDVLLVDTAGRLHVDEEMMDEIKLIHSLLNPIETLFIVDSMTGQDAAKTAKAFDLALPLTGVILTKIDGDARGGAALSIRHLTQKPIKFIGVGEKLNDLEPFYPDRVASRILGMGDMLSLIEEIETKVDKKKAEKLAKRASKGKFDLNDLREHLKQMRGMGGFSGLMDKLPGMGAIPQAAKQKLNDSELTSMIAVIDSMTNKERQNPNLVINKAFKGSGSRKRRISNGSGRSVQELNKTMKMLGQMQKMMKKFSSKGLKGMLGGLKGKLPEGMIPPEFGDFQ